MSTMIRGGRQTHTDETGRTITVTTNNRERPLVSWHDLPESDRAAFDYVTGEDRHSARFVHFRDYWLDTDDTEGLAPDRLRALGWSTYLSTSFFDGIVFRHFTTDGDYLDDTVIVGHYTV